MTRKWSVNITPTERVARVLVGLVGAIGGLWLLSGSPSTAAARAGAGALIAAIGCTLMMVMMMGGMGHGGGGDARR